MYASGYVKRSANTSRTRSCKQNIDHGSALRLAIFAPPSMRESRLTDLLADNLVNQERRTLGDLCYRMCAFIRRNPARYRDAFVIAN